MLSPKFLWWIQQRQLLMKSLIKMAQDITGSEIPRVWFPTYKRLYDKHMENFPYDYQKGTPS